MCLELCGWLNETSLALQTVVQCYGLIAPLLHHKIPSVPVIQVGLLSTVFVSETVHVLHVCVRKGAFGKRETLNENKYIYACFFVYS